MRIENVNGWLYEVTGDTERITPEIQLQLQEYDGDIFWNNATCRHWAFDFKINGIWFTDAEIDYTNNTIKLYAGEFAGIEL